MYFSSVDVHDKSVLTQYEDHAMIVGQFTLRGSLSFCIKRWTYDKNPGDQHGVLVFWIKFWGSDIHFMEDTAIQDGLDVLQPHFLEIKTQQKRSALSIL